MLLVIDIQGKLAEIVHKSKYLIQNAAAMINGARLFDIPIIWTEQTPDKIGATIPELNQILEIQEPIIKKTFSCCGDPGFIDALKATGKKQVMVTGIETHVCVYQTVMDLLDMGYEVEVIADAVSSRFKHNKQIGLDKMMAAGAGISSVEMALFELQVAVDNDRFKQLIKLIK